MFSMMKPRGHVLKLGNQWTNKNNQPKANIYLPNVAVYVLDTWEKTENIVFTYCASLETYLYFPAEIHLFWIFYFPFLYTSKRNVKTTFIFFFTNCTVIILNKRDQLHEKVPVNYDFINESNVLTSKAILYKPKEAYCKCSAFFAWKKRLHK